MLTLAIFVCLWLVWAVAANAILDNPRREVAWGLLWRVGRVYVRVVHQLEAYGREHLPRSMRAGPLVIVVNHTAGVDPVLVQSLCRFHIDWMMGKDMMLPGAAWFWEWAGIIPVDRFGRDTTSAREAIRRIETGGVVGIFPEGGIEHPPDHILPFMAGVGLIIRRTGAPVLPIVIDGTPKVTPAWAALWTASRSRVRVMPPIDYTSSGLSAEGIAADLHARFLAWTGWPEAARADRR